MKARVLVKSVHPRAVLDEPVQVDVPVNNLGRLEKTLRFGQKTAVFADHGLGVPGQVRRRFARSGGGKEVCGNTPGRLIEDEAGSVFRFSHGHVGSGEICHDRGSRQGGEARRRNGNPEIFADFGEQLEPRQVVHGKNEVGPERNIPLSQEGNRCRPGLRRLGELAGLVKFPVVGEIGLNGDAEYPAPVQDDTAIEKPGVHPKRKPCDNDEVQFSGGVDELVESFEDAFQECVLLKQVLVGIGRKEKFGKQGEKSALAGRFPGETDPAFHVEGRVGHLDFGKTYGGAKEPVAVQIEKFM